PIPVCTRAQTGSEAAIGDQRMKLFRNGDRGTQVPPLGDRRRAGELQTIDTADEDEPVAVDDDDIRLDQRPDQRVAPLPALSGPAPDRKADRIAVRIAVPLPFRGGSRIDT